MEDAVIGHGEDLGRFDGLGGLGLRRDKRFPVRVTIQFYRATSNGVISNKDIRVVKSQIDRVYRSADYVGSLVVDRNHHTRPTDWRRIRHKCGLH